jgi:hypothetical protein
VRGMSELMYRRGITCLAVLSVLLLAGCSTALPPYIVVFESYFPSWLVSATLGCIAALIVRVIFVRSGIDEYLPLPLLTYIAIAAIFMFLTSLLVFSR